MSQAMSTGSDQQTDAKQPAGGIRRRLTGRVVSDKMAKTVTVLVERKVKHALYGKYMTRSRKYHAHDENNEFHPGDLVLIEECRPRPRRGRWCGWLRRRARPDAGRRSLLH
jgi:small subunit ribosomal protein S17